MRLSEVMSRPITGDYSQVESFMGKQKLSFGKHRKIDVGKIAIDFYCKHCENIRNFCSGDELVCVGAHDHLISIDCALKCSVCNSTVQIWFLIEFDGDMLSQAPKVRIVNKYEKLSSDVLISKEQYGEFSELLEKSEVAFRAGLGAGAVVYLRTIFETIISQIGDSEKIERKFIDKNGKTQYRTFEQYLEEVDKKSSVIPKEFSSDKYKLFRELSGVVHGNCDENTALEKFRAFHRLVTEILKKVKDKDEQPLRTKEITDAMSIIGLSGGGEEDE